MALDLESLQDVGTDRWNREWQRAYVELGYVAVSVARRFLGRRFPQHVELVAGDALIKLSETGIHRCRTVEDIVLLLRKIAFQAVVDFLRRRSVRPEGHVQENVDAAEFAAAEGEDNFERLKDEIAERQHLEGFDEERLIRLFVQEFRLTPLEQALLREHIITIALSRNSLISGF